MLVQALRPSHKQKSVFWYFWAGKSKKTRLGSTEKHLLLDHMFWTISVPIQCVHAMLRLFKLERSWETREGLDWGVFVNRVYLSKIILLQQGRRTPIKDITKLLRFYIRADFPSTQEAIILLECWRNYQQIWVIDNNDGKIIPKLGHT